jgi:glycosyltransferase involved in cell wall biosynthesis
MIGLGIVTYNRPSYLRRSVEAWTEHCSDVLDSIHVYVDGFSADGERNKRYEQLVKRYRREGIDARIGKRNRGVAFAKNELFRAMLNEGCSTLFIAEDDILAESPMAITGYMAACEESGLHHLSFHKHGPGNQRALAVGDGTTLWPDFIGAFACYSRECLEAAGLYPEGMHNAYEHVFHSVRLGELGFTSPWKCAADATGSEEWLEEIPESIDHSSIPDGPKRLRDQAAARALWRELDPGTYVKVFDERGNVRQNVPLPESVK